MSEEESSDPPECVVCGDLITEAPHVATYIEDMPLTPDQDLKYRHKWCSPEEWGEEE